MYGKLLKNITCSRIANYLTARVSYWYSNLTNNVCLNAKPISASIEPANYCNLSCPHCPTGRRLIEKTDKRLTFNDFKEYLDKLKKKVKNFCCGECTGEQNVLKGQRLNLKKISQTNQDVYF